MKIVQWGLAVVGAVALAAVLVGLFLPSSFAVRRSIDIAAPADRIYDYVVEPRKWSQWSVWTRRDPAMRIVYSGPPFGMGARWTWESRSEGSGTMELTRVEPNRRVEYALFFPAFNIRSAGAIAIEPRNGVMRVTWTNEGDVGGNPLKHYLAAAMDRIVGPDFEQGLANLKTLAEKT
jgi:uncharacterized protein YndB with AHSA1/START domain